jgi:two-component system cell cycle response regulator
MQERRKINRTRVLKAAKFLLGKSSVIDCVVRDLTNAGAGVEVPNTIDLPEALDLTFNGGRSSRRCRRVWQKLNRAGVEFY